MNDLETKFRGHETFYIRKGWLYKGLKSQLFCNYSRLPIKERCHIHNQTNVISQLLVAPQGLFDMFENI